MTRPDVAVIGAGLVGLATADALLRARPGRGVVVLEKEDEVAAHQSGRNSGVIHSGLYYRPGSLKARLCRAGRAALLELCAAEGVAHDVCGKVVVATREEELPRLDALAALAAANGVATTRLDPEGLRAREPHAAGLAALHVPDAGVADYPAVARALARRVVAAGGEVRTGVRVERGVDDGVGVALATTAGPLRADRVVACPGLHADRVARSLGARFEERVVPFRGEFLELTSDAEHLCRTLVYPVPDPALPFLGVHFTRGHDGRVHCGPNAVPALAREGYRATDVSLRDGLDALAWSGALGLARRHGLAALGEARRSLDRDAFVRALQRLVPDVRAEHLRPSPSGVRAQLVTPAGELVDDFRIERSARAVLVLNAPSPAATACLAIGEEVAGRLDRA